MSDSTIFNNQFKFSTLSLSNKLIFKDGSIQTTAYTGTDNLNTSTYVINTLNDATNGVIGELSSPLTLINVYTTLGGSFYFTNNNINQPNLYLIFNKVLTGDISLTIYDVNNNSPLYTTNNNIYIINVVNGTLFYGFTEFNTSGVLSFNFNNISINDTDGFVLYISSFQYL
jgi:hypothetical protein